jgi:hypothetical protein
VESTFESAGLKSIWHLGIVLRMFATESGGSCPGISANSLRDAIFDNELKHFGVMDVWHKLIDLNFFKLTS